MKPRCGKSLHWSVAALDRTELQLTKRLLPLTPLSNPYRSTSVATPRRSRGTYLSDRYDRTPVVLALARLPAVRYPLSRAAPGRRCIRA